MTKEVAVAQFSIKTGDSLIVDGWNGDIILKFDRIGGGCADLSVDTPENVSVKRGKNPRLGTDVQHELKEITKEIASLLSGVDAVAGQELLSQLVSDLFYAQAQRRQQEERRVKQAKGIAQAKARGVRFGVARKPLPENFDECRQKWRSGEFKMAEAAEACGMAKSSFYDAAIRKERSLGCVG